MRKLACFTFISVVACSGATPAGSTAPSAQRGPSPGPRAEDGIDDRGLADLASDLQGRTGDDQARAELRLLTAQTRAFVVAVVHALTAPAPSAGDSTASASPDPGTASARFDPPATLVGQLGARGDCGNGGAAHTCTARLGNELLSRINALHPPADLEPQKQSLLAAMAALEESRVVIPTDTRWRVLQADDTAAHLAQALTLLFVTRHIAHAAAVAAPCEHVAHIAARLVDQLAIGPCSDAYQQLFDTDTTAQGHGEGLSALATAGCVPNCARGALSATTHSDPLAEAAQACRTESALTAFAPFDAAAAAIGDWARSAKTRLEALSNDAAVSALLAARPGSSMIIPLPMPPPLFLSGNGTSVQVPAAPEGSAAGLAMGSAAVLVWVPAAGDVIVTSAQSFSLDEQSAASTRIGPIDGLGERLVAVAGPGANHAAVALVIDPDVRASRIVGVLQALANLPDGAPSHDHVIGLTVRNGPFSGYVPLRISAAPAAQSYRVGAATIASLSQGHLDRAVQVAAAPASGADTLGEMVPSAAPAGSLGIALEADATGAMLARVASALAVYAARAATPETPSIVPTLSDGPMFSGLDDARTQTMTTAIEHHRAEVLRCFDHAAPGSSMVRLDVQIHVDPHARITIDSASTLGTPAADHCVTSALRSWRLPAPTQPAGIHLSYIIDSSASSTAASAAPSAAPQTQNTTHAHSRAGGRY